MFTRRCRLSCPRSQASVGYNIIAPQSAPNKLHGSSETIIIVSPYYILHFHGQNRCSGRSLCQASQYSYEDLSSPSRSRRGILTLMISRCIDFISVQFQTFLFQEGSGWLREAITYSFSTSYGFGVYHEHSSRTIKKFRSRMGNLKMKSLNRWSLRCLTEAGRQWSPTTSS